MRPFALFLCSVHQIEQLIAVCFGVALLKAVGCKLLCGVILGLLCGIFRTGVTLLHPLLVACLPRKRTDRR